MDGSDVSKAMGPLLVLCRMLLPVSCLLTVPHVEGMVPGHEDELLCESTPNSPAQNMGVRSISAASAVFTLIPALDDSSVYLLGVHCPDLADYGECHAFVAKPDNS